MDPFSTSDSPESVQIPKEKIQFATAVVWVLGKVGDLLLTTLVIGACMFIGGLLLWGLGNISDASGAGLQTATTLFYGSWWLVGILAPLLILTIAVSSDNDKPGPAFLSGFLATIGIFVFMALLWPLGWLLAWCGGSIAWFGHLPYESWWSALYTTCIAAGISILIVFVATSWKALNARLEAERESREARERAEYERAERARRASEQPSA